MEKKISPLKRPYPGLGLALLLCLAVCWPAFSVAGGEWAVYFSPRGGCTEAIVKTLGAARASVLVQAYSFTSRPIARALIDAQARGVKVKVILDLSKLTEKNAVLPSLAAAGVPVWIDGAHRIAHNKVMIIDGETVITGSFNFTRAAEDDHAENLLIIRDQELSARYGDNWENHRRHATPYEKGVE
jgi:phosphatidylserine/phosphatidylglycerophosphate/cardiolipin synthase-like enzyme